MDLESRRIWDYSSDAYVHKLIQDKLGTTFPDSKTSSLDKSLSMNDGTDFEDLLAAQLESQRLYYENRITAASTKAFKAVEASKVSEASLRGAREELQQSLDDLEHAKRQVTRTSDIQNQLEKKMKVITELTHRMKAQYMEEKSINASLMTRIAFTECRLKETEASKLDSESEVSQLTEQVRDLMLHFASVKSISRLSHEDLHCASVSICAMEAI